MHLSVAQGVRREASNSGPHPGSSSPSRHRVGFRRSFEGSLEMDFELDFLENLAPSFRESSDANGAASLEASGVRSGETRDGVSDGTSDLVSLRIGLQTSFEMSFRMSFPASFPASFHAPNARVNSYQLPVSSGGWRIAGCGWRKPTWIPRRREGHETDGRGMDGKSSHSASRASWLSSSGFG
jgi:hypothetical protein